MLLLCALIVGSGNLWAEDITYTLTITEISKPNSGSGYAAYDGSRSIDAVCTTDANKKYSVSIVSSNVMMQSSKIQFKKGSGYIYNNTNLGTVTNISINSTAGNYTKTYGTSANPTSGSAGDGKGYFRIKESNSATGTVSQIVITFKFTIPSITFNNGNVTEEESLDLRTLFSSNSEGDVTYTITSGDTYGQIESDGYTLTGLAEGSVTIKASQAAKGIYAAKEQSATITVVSASAPKATITPTTLSFGDVEVGQTKNLTFTITPANLTGDLTIASNNNKYTVSPTSIAQETTTAQTITVTAAPTAANDDVDGQISISGGGITTQYVTLSATPYVASAVSLVADPVGKGTFTYNEATVTDIDSKVGATITVTAVSADGYKFDSWTATGATPASSDDAETEFTLSAATVTLTANFIYDPQNYATLDGTTIPAPASNVSYGTKQTFTKNGLAWETTGYQQKDLHCIQLTNTNTPYLKLPNLSGKIQTITFSVTASSATAKGGAKTDRNLIFKATSDGEALVTSTNGSTNEITLDLTGLASNYNTGYINASNSLRIWEVTIAYLPTITVSATCSDGTTKYATYCNENAFEVPAGLTISAVTINNQGKLELMNYTTVVPANTGVLVAGDAGTYDIALSGESGEVKTGNLLHPGGVTDEEMAELYPSCKYYKLALQKNGESYFANTAGFYWGADNGGAFTSGANKAYLAVPTGETLAPAHYLLNEEENNATSINDIEASDKVVKFIENGRILILRDGITYDALGRKVR